MTSPDTPVQSSSIFTLGKLFSDGSAIERLRDDRLVLHHDGKEVISPSISWHDQLYAAAPLDPKLQQNSTLPSRTADIGSVQDLVSDLTLAIGTKAELDQEAALLVASYVVSTWVMDCLPGVVCLNPWGPAGTTDALLDLLSCLCRRPLRLVNAGIPELASLPEDLCPTIILREPNQQMLSRLLAATGEPNTVVLGSGRWMSLRCSIVACTRFPATVRALSIPVLSAKAQDRINRVEAAQFSEEFQPRLLRYRLTEHSKVTDSRFDVQGFAPQARVTARFLGGALAGTPEVQSRIVDALRPIDEQYKTEQAEGVDSVVLEALLALCHENRDSARVLEIAELANTILLGRQDRRELPPKTVGHILRKNLGFSVKRRGSGYELDFSNEVCDRLHGLAWSQGVLSTLQPKAECLFCSGFSQTNIVPASVISSTSSTPSTLSTLSTHTKAE